MNMFADSTRVVEHDTSRLGRWLRARRTRIVLWIALVEAIVVAVFHDVSRWSVIGLAIVAVAVYFAVGRGSRSDTFRQVTWILAASQLLAVLAAILAFIVFWTAIIAVVIFAVVALYFV
ncbi:MAG: hypothetical protein ABR569_09950, partial [Gaiellaceae bacterium]